MGKSAFGLWTLHPGLEEEERDELLEFLSEESIPGVWVNDYKQRGLPIRRIHWFPPFDQFSAESVEPLAAWLTERGQDSYAHVFVCNDYLNVEEWQVVGPTCGHRYHGEYPEHAWMTPWLIKGSHSDARYREPHVASRDLMTFFERLAWATGIGRRLLTRPLQEVPELAEEVEALAEELPDAAYMRALANELHWDMFGEMGDRLQSLGDFELELFLGMQVVRLCAACRPEWGAHVEKSSRQIVPSAYPKRPNIDYKLASRPNLEDLLELLEGVGAEARVMARALRHLWVLARTVRGERLCDVIHPYFDLYEMAARRLPEHGPWTELEAPSLSFLQTLTERPALRGMLGGPEDPLVGELTVGWLSQHLEAFWRVLASLHERAEAGEPHAEAALESGLQTCLIHCWYSSPARFEEVIGTPDWLTPHVERWESEFGDPRAAIPSSS